MTMIKNGFTLIELMITVAIIAILAAIALPTYNEHIVKTKRSVASSCLLEHAQSMERFYTTSMSYASATLVAGCSNDLSGSYTFAFGASQPTTATFVISAQPTGGQLNDTKCGALSIDQTGTKSISGTKSVAECWK